MTTEELQKLLINQAQITAIEVATFCANICDSHRGHLQVGDMIRKQFGINQKQVEPEKEKKSHLTLVKGN